MLRRALTSLARGDEERRRPLRTGRITAPVAAALLMKDLDCAISVTALSQKAQCSGTGLIYLNVCDAIEHVCPAGIIALDLGGKATTRAICEAKGSANPPEGARA